MSAAERAPLALSLVAAATSVVALGLVASGCCGDAEDSQAGGAPPGRELSAESVSSGYATAARHGDLVWTAGHLPVRAVPGSDVGRQTDEVLTALERTLEGAGAGLDTVVMSHVYLRDFDDWPAFNTAYVQRFPEGLPPRVTVQVVQLGRGDVEIAVVAHVREPGRQGPP